MKNELELKPSYWADVSGGKDSLYMLKVILSNPQKYPLDGVIHFELEIDYPFIKNVIDYMKSECNKRGIKFVCIKPRNKWIDLYNMYLFPTRKARWCNSSYKLDALKQHQEYMKSLGYKTISYIGYCVDEFNRYDKRKNTNEIYPLVIENIEESQILEWAKTQPIFNNYYLTNKRCGCMYCPMSSMLEMAYLYKYYPKEYEQLMQYAKHTEEIQTIKLGRPFSVWASNSKYNTEYRDNIIKTKWINILNEMEEKENPQ